METIGDGTTFTCADCGFSSPHRPQFVDFGDGSRKRTGCAHCVDRRNRRSFWGHVALATFFVVFGCVRLQYDSSSLPSAVLVVIYTYLLMMAFIAFPHEAAHALMARCVGLRPISVEIGQGVTWVDRQVMGVRLRVRTPINSGATYAVFRKGKGIDWRFIATTAAAGTIEILTGALLLLWFWSDEWRPSSAGLRLMLLGCAGALIADAVWNLWPAMTKLPHGETANDGMLIRQTLARRPVDLPAHRAGIRLKRAEFAYADGRFDQVRVETAKALALSHHPAVITSAAVLTAEAFSESGRPAEAITHLRPLLDREDLEPTMRGYLAHAFAWAALLQDEPEVREEGLRRLDQALPVLPWNGVCAVKLLCLLAATAKDDDRRSRANRLAEGIRNFRLHGEARAYLELARGLAAAMNNDSRMARQFLEAARRRGAADIALQVLERRIASD